MSRLNRYAHSLFSGYVLLGANTLFTLGSVPLALRYLSKPEFGLWALVAQIAVFMALLDFGIAGASRILIDYKDDKRGGEYGGVILTTVIVSAVQAVLILACGIGVGFVLQRLLKLPPLLARDFLILTVGQTALLAGSFLTRVFGFLLGAHQRYDVTNYTQSALFFVNLMVLWFGFEAGWGVYSLLWGQLAAWVLGTAVMFFWCLRLKLLPPAGCWGRPTWQCFWHLFTFGRDIFLFTLGYVLIHASQTIIVTRGLGLDAAAVWSVCTRTFTLITQVIYRVLDYSCPTLAEMIVRQERDRLFIRFRSIVVVSISLSVVAGVLFSVCNQPFVHIWSSGRIGWPTVNDVLLALWLVIAVPTHSHLLLVGQTKDFRFLPYVYLFEGLCFASLSVTILSSTGITGMLVMAILCSLSFSFPYGIWRTAQYFRLPWKTVAVDWARPAFRLVVVLVPLGVLIWILGRPLPMVLQLVLAVALLGSLGLKLLVRYGTDETLQSEIQQRLPGWMRRLWLLRLAPQKSTKT